MYKFLTIGALFLASISAQAFEIKGARLDTSKKNILVDVVYGGGCFEHKFELDLRGCLESMPAQCSANLVDVSTELDTCEAIVGKTVSINLNDAGIKGNYFSEASLKIFGPSYKADNSALVYLPVLTDEDDSDDSDDSIVKAASTHCLTHTGSLLKISPSEKQVTLIPLSADEQTFKITKVSSLSLESNPPVWQTNYKLNDGRSIVTEFRGTKTTGTGYFIRVDNSTSDEFACTTTK